MADVGRKTRARAPLFIQLAASATLLGAAWIARAEAPQGASPSSGGATAPEPPPPVRPSPRPETPYRAEAPPAWPRLGGHLGLALPILSVDNNATAVIGRDFGQLGITPGITINLSKHWAIDLELIGSSKWIRDHGATAAQVQTIVVVDPGVVYGFGPVAIGLRLAVQIGGGLPFNLGLVPIVVVPFKITRKLSYFIEADLPVFILSTPPPAVGGDGQVLGSFNIQLQTGFAF
jgi:hypothetical protein